MITVETVVKKWTSKKFSVFADWLCGNVSGVCAAPRCRETSLIQQRNWQWEVQLLQGWVF